MIVWTILFAVGIIITALGFGEFSHRKYPELGEGFVILGFLFRILGPLILIFVGSVLLGYLLPWR